MGLISTNTKTHYQSTQPSIEGKGTSTLGETTDANMDTSKNSQSLLLPGITH